MNAMNRRLILRSRPCGMATQENVPLELQAMPALAQGQVRVRNRYLSIDPAIRDWMSDRPSYLPPIALGEAVRSTTLGEVVESRHPSFKPGDLALGLNAWEDFSLAEGGALGRIELAAGDAEQHYLSVFGAVGLTAYFALLDVGRPQAGETVLVSAAAGAVGSLVGQIARIKGCRVVGLAGSEEKCRWIVDELGFDAAINYRTADNLSEAIAQACPEGVDIYFDNVGGAMLDAALMNIRDRARIVFCGAIASYNSTAPVPGPYNLWQILVHSARFEGFLIRDYFSRFPEGIAQMREWLESGQIHFREQVVEGLENSLDAFNSLFDGRNTGKVLVRL